MRRLSGVVLAGAMLILPAFSQSLSAQDAAAQPAAQPAAPKTTFEGDTVIMIYAINAGKDADYEQVMAKLKAALAKSTDPQAKEQAAGWMITKSSPSLTKDGTSTYMHVINPVVKGADYNIVNIVYSQSTDDEKRAFYELYKGALAGVLSKMEAKAVSKMAP